MSGLPTRINAAEHLKGLTLDGRWKVVLRRPREADVHGEVVNEIVG